MFKRPSLIAMLLLALTVIALPAQAASDDGGPVGGRPARSRPPIASRPDRSAIAGSCGSTTRRSRRRPASAPVSWQWRSERTANGKLQLDSPAAQQYRAALEQQQTSVFAQIQRALPGAQLQRRYQIVFNGLSVALPGVAASAAIERLQAMPGVAAVYPEQHYQLNMYASIPQIGADKLWASRLIGGQQNAGKGIKIAIIDAGIKIDNPFFNPAGFSYPPGYPKGDTAHTTPKVIVARAYFRPDLPPLPARRSPEPGPTASSHGTHTAGTAAGVANTSATISGLTEVISGVAPRAYLMNYKVFYENDSPFSGQSFTTELLAALEDAVADDADVISNSWGGRPDVDPRFDPIVIAAEAAVDAGVTVVFSAGNDGPSPSTAGSPGFSDKLITRGRYHHGQDDRQRLCRCDCARWRAGCAQAAALRNGGLRPADQGYSVRPGALPAGGGAGRAKPGLRSAAGRLAERPGRADRARHLPIQPESLQRPAGRRQRSNDLQFGGRRRGADSNGGW